MESVSEKPQHVGVDSKSQVERDRIDLNHEISGEPTGRIPRFLAKNHHGVGSESEKKKSERRYRNMLEMLLAEDARYAKLYYEVQDTLNKARQAVDQALIDIHQHLEEAERTLRIMQDNATRLEDGTMVFRSTIDGHVYTEDGRKLSDDEAQSVELSENAPSQEDYNTQREKVVALKDQKSEAETYKRDIDHAEERLHDAENPLTLEELETLERDISENSLFSRKAGEQQSICDTKASSVAQEICVDKNLKMPPMNSQFDKARLDLPDVETLPQFTKNQTTAPAV